MCEKNGSLLIVDEIQTGFCRTGPMFVTGSLDLKADFMTMAKGIAGGFPFGAFAMSERVASRLELSDHGGTYCGNPLGCAVAYAVIRYLIERKISENVEKLGLFALAHLNEMKNKCPDSVVDVRGKGLLLLIDFRNERTADRISDKCLSNGLFVRQTQHTGIRIFPALNIQKEEMEEGLDIIEAAVKEAVGIGIENNGYE
jgi:acetylornithine/N-succinyldiaminopimelate aminotransferase